MLRWTHRWTRRRYSLRSSSFREKWRSAATVLRCVTGSGDGSSASKAMSCLRSEGTLLVLRAVYPQESTRRQRRRRRQRQRRRLELEQEPRDLERQGRRPKGPNGPDGPNSPGTSGGLAAARRMRTQFACRADSTAKVLAALLAPVLAGT